ncbi:MAG: phosphoribosylformylglycinamidine synthase subunit PurQ [Thermoplasmataceae archaeon]
MSSPFKDSVRFKAAILRMEGTNCEEESFFSLRYSGFDPEYVHVKELESGKRKLNDFSLIFIPGGFSAGDYVRAGAIFGSRLLSSRGEEMMEYIESERPVIGICNGFQVLTEMGILPDTEGNKEREVALTVNKSGRFECRYTYVRIKSKNVIMKEFSKQDARWLVPVAHSEGRVMFRNKDEYEKLERENQIPFVYSAPDGSESEYPWNPNGSFMGIAGLSNKKGNVIGLMPHPERIYFDNIQTEKFGNKPQTFGKMFFDQLYRYVSGLN